MSPTHLKHCGALLASLVCAPGIASGEQAPLLPQDLSARVWTKQEGLPDNSVTSVLQTRDGYLWVGTSGGLARFDGIKFTIIAPASEQKSAAIRVTALCEDSTGRLWIGTQGNGLLCYADRSITHFQASNNLLNETINSLAADAAGNLWLGTPSGLDVLEHGKLTRFTSREGLTNEFVSNVHVARSGTVWITTHGGMCQFKNNHLYPFPFQTDSPGRNPESLGVYEDRFGNLWAFGDTYLVNLAENKHLNHFGSGDTTSSIRIWSLCEGQRGELWIGTSGKALYCFVDNKFQQITLSNGGLTSDVRALCEDRQGNIWLGTDGGGLVRLQPRNLRLLDAGVGLPARPAVCIAFAPQGRAWIGFDRAGLYTGTAERFDRVTDESTADLPNLVSSICIGPDSSLWVGTPGSGLYRLTGQQATHYTSADGLSDDVILSLAADSAGMVWIGTQSGSVHCFEGGTLKTCAPVAVETDYPVTAILPSRTGGVWLGLDGGGVVRHAKGQFHSAVDPLNVGGKAVNALEEDSSGQLWLGTSGGRLACLNAAHFTSWDLNAGSLHSPIFGILSDDAGDLWFGMDKSIYRITQKDLSAALSSRAAARPELVYEADNVGPEFGWPRAVKTPDGKLWFAMANGVVTIDPRGQMRDSVPPPVAIEEATVNGQPLERSFGQTSSRDPESANLQVRLPANVRTLEFHYTALDLSAPEKLRFRHRLDHADLDWVDSGADRIVHYEHLPFGAYKFRVQAGDASGWYEGVASCEFLIPTPPWRTDWALAFYGLSAATLVALTARLVSHRRLRRSLAALAAQRATERERMRIAQDMHDEIGSKLTKISFMSERAKGELVGQAQVAGKLDSIAHTSRDLLQSLDEIVWAVNPHNDTLEHLAAYLGHYATEYLQNTAVEPELNIPPNLPHHPLSSEIRHNLFLAFEEALNNALKHGQASRIRVDMVNESSQFEIRMEDNGRGFDSEALLSKQPDDAALPGPRVGNGLRNMRQRLAEAGGECTIRSTPGNGTIVRLLIPLTR